MRLLVDTHILPWALVEPQKLSRSWQARLEAAENEILFSAVSIWELAIKRQIGRLVLPIELEDLMEAAKTIGFADLPVSAAHAAGV
jgi:PIN domain nuclease of toxin-antitoxin system